MHLKLTFNGVRVTRSLVFCVVFCRSLIALLPLFLLTIVLCVLHRFTDSDYPFGIFKLFFKYQKFQNIFWYSAKLENSNFLKCYFFFWLSTFGNERKLGMNSFNEVTCKTLDLSRCLESLTCEPISVILCWIHTTTLVSHCRLAVIQ